MTSTVCGATSPRGFSCSLKLGHRRPKYHVAEGYFPNDPRDVWRDGDPQEPLPEVQRFLPPPRRVRP